MSTPNWLTELRGKAEAAAPGPWKYDDTDWYGLNPEGKVDVPITSPDTAKFIAAANPKTVLWLLDMLEMAVEDLGGSAEYEAGPGGET